MFKVQCFRWQAIKVQCFCVQRNMDAFATPAPAQDYVQGALLQMTGDQGAVLFVCRGTWTLLSPPRPCPGLCSRCSASDDRRSRCSAFVCRGTWTLLSPPRPCPGLCSRCSASDDRRSRCSALLLCAEEHERFCPPPAPAQDYVQGAVLQMTGDQGAVLLCAEEHERFCPPHTPNQTLNGWVKWWFKSMDPTLVPSINDAFVPLHPPIKP